MVIQAKELNTSELYYKIPQAFNYPPYDKLSLRAEKLYGVILWRLRGSIKNGFVDDIGVYCNFSVKELEPILKCSNRVVIKAKKELADAGLLVEKRRFNASNKIYLEHPVNDETSLSEMTNGHISNDETSLSEMTNGHTIESYIYRVNNKELEKEIDSTAVGGENNRQTTLIGADLSQSVGRPPGWSGIQSYLESQRLGLSPKQISELEDFMEIDGLEKSLIEKAIDITAGETGSKRKYNYLKGILTNWKNGNIKTVADHEANEAEREKTPKRIFKNKRLQEKWDNYDDSNDLF